jgi:hypothetical protein
MEVLERRATDQSGRGGRQDGDKRCYNLGRRCAPSRDQEIAFLQSNACLGERT